MMGKYLIGAGILLILVGLLWPILVKIPFGRLPGDIVFGRDNFKIYIPVATSIVISIILTLILWFLRK